MSEKKSRRQSMWALVLSHPDDPLLIALNRFVEKHKDYCISSNGTVIKMRALRLLVVFALKTLGTQENDVEGLRLIAEHEARERTREALNTGAPLPMNVPQQIPQPVPTVPQVSPPNTPQPVTPITLSPIPLAPTPPTPQQTPASATVTKKVISGVFHVTSSGHMKKES